MEIYLVEIDGVDRERLEHPWKPFVCVAVDEYQLHTASKQSRMEGLEGDEFVQVHHLYPTPTTTESATQCLPGIQGK